MFINKCEKSCFISIYYFRLFLMQFYIRKLQQMKRISAVLFVFVFNFSFIFSQEIKIFTWNVFMVPPIIFKSCQTERAYLIADYVKTINPDIIVFDETFMKSTRAIINEKLKEIYPYQSDITKRGLLKTNSGVWIFSKYPILKQDFLIYKKKKSSDIFARKGATFLELNINNKKIQIVGSHVQSLVKNASTRVKQFHQLKNETLDKYFKDSIPQFIIGDLNCDYYDTSEYKNMIDILQTLPISFVGEKYSWNGLENDLANKFSEHTLETLDYILLRKQHNNLANITSTEILKPYSDTCICDRNFHYLSDHHPVISTILLK